MHMMLKGNIAHDIIIIIASTFYFKNEGRLPRAAPHSDVSEVLELDFPTILLQMGLELVWSF